MKETADAPTVTVTVTEGLRWSEAMLGLNSLAETAAIYRSVTREQVENALESAQRITTILNSLLTK